MIRSQVRMRKQQQRAIWNLIRIRKQGQELTDMQIAKLREGLAIVVDDDLRKQLAELDVFLMRITRNALDVVKADEKMIGGVDDEQLNAQIRAEVIKAAYTFTEQDWELILEVRRVQRTKGARAAMLLARSPNTNKLKEQT